MYNYLKTKKPLYVFNVDTEILIYSWIENGIFSIDNKEHPIEKSSYSNNTVSLKNYWKTVLGYNDSSIDILLNEANEMENNYGATPAINV